MHRVLHVLSCKKWRDEEKNSNNKMSNLKTVIIITTFGLVINIITRNFEIPLLAI